MTYQAWFSQKHANTGAVNVNRYMLVTGEIVLVTGLFLDGAPHWEDAQHLGEVEYPASFMGTVIKAKFPYWAPTPQSSYSPPTLELESDEPKTD